MKNDIVRQKATVEQFEKIETNFTFYLATPYRELIMSQGEINGLNKQEKAFYSRVGANHSHYSVFQEILKDESILDTDYVAIFEDDVYFPSSEIFHITFNLGLEELQKTNPNFDVLYLGANLPHFITPQRPIKGRVINNQIIELQEPFVTCVHAVIYKKSFLRILASNFYDTLMKCYIIPAEKRIIRPHTWPTKEMIDNFLPWLLFETKRPILTFYPPIATQKCTTGSYNFANFNGNVPCGINYELLKNFNGYKKLKSYKEIWPVW